ncbi:hypothetical protein ACHAW5_006952 [Stephanodiscus triporus]|uniref:Uncharacterized protein n=1 Tax=Stephanodiscus triporus TaxID=2934178 RepID=A0ABD3MU36_9STRA
MPLYKGAPFLFAIAQVLQYSGSGFSSAFIAHSTHPHTVSRAVILTVKSANEPDEVRTDGKSSSMMTLNFEGETSITSNPAKFVEGKSLHEFFALPHTAQLVLRGSKNNQIHEIENVDAELFERYKRSCATLKASLPTADDRIFDVSTSAVSFPGLRVMSLVTIGVKIITKTDPPFPSYEMVLIRDSTYAEGNRLFVWFFNKITGKDKDNADGSLRTKNDQTTFSLNRFGVVKKENGMISFQANASLIVQIRFPSFLMKAIPGASKEKFEKIGGESLQKALEDDLPAALEGFRQEYVRWLEN